MQKAIIFKGIEYIRLSQLPKEEKEQISNWLQRDMIIKIQTDNELLTDCINYKDYKHWFSKIYTQISPVELTEKAAAKQSQRKPLTGLAFD